MPTPPHRATLALALVFALTACSQEKRDGQVETKPAAANAAAHANDIPAAQSAADTDSAASITTPNPRAPASFTCDNGSTVAIADLVAVVTLKDGRTVQIARDPDDAFHFRGEALSFRMKDGEGALSQDEGGTSRCTGG